MMRIILHPEAALLRPIASISSIYMMHGFKFLASLKRDLTRPAPNPPINKNKHHPST